MSLQGTIKITYQELVDIFGNPTFRIKESSIRKNDNKTTCEWQIEIDDRIISIYDWKEDVTPLYLYDWHIGGKSKDDIKKILEIVSKK